MKREHWLDEPKNVKRLWHGFLVVVALTVVAGFFVNLHPHFEIEKLPGFNAVYGFITCLLMIVGAKALGLLLKRGDGYYTGNKREDKRDE